MSVYSDVELLVPMLRRCTNLERLRFTLHRMDHRDQELPELGSVLRLKYLGLLNSSFSFNSEGGGHGDLVKRCQFEILETNIENVVLRSHKHWWMTTATP